MRNYEFPLSLYIEHTSQAQHQLQYGRHWCSQSDQEQRCISQPAHEIGNRYSGTEGTDDSLDHDEFSHADAIIKSCITEEKAGKHTLDGLIECGSNDLWVRGENGCQRVSVEIGDEKHADANDEGNASTVVQGFYRPV